MKLQFVFLLAAACAVAATRQPVEASNILSATHSGTNVVGEPVITAGGLNPGALLMESRTHVLALANYDSTAASLTLSAPNGADIASLPFPSYLAGSDYVRVDVSNRSVADYQMVVTTAVPSVVYLLLDNRLGDSGAASNNLNDPELSKPEHAWVLDNGWTRVNTGLTPNGAGDFAGADENNDGSLNQFYAIYRNVTGAGNQITLGAQNESRNMYVVAAQPIPEPGSLMLAGAAALLASTRRRSRG